MRIYLNYVKNLKLKKFDKTRLFELKSIMSETIEQKCLSKGVKLTDQRRIIAKVMSESYGESRSSGCR